MNNNISFTAKFISPATVKKLTPNGKYVDIEVSAVKLASKNKDDLSALEKINKEWGADTYASNILDEASSTNEFYKDYRPTVYAITTQRDNFEKLEPEKVLGLAETSIEFGIIKSLSICSFTPNPLQSGQAPYGALKLKSLGSSSGSENSQYGQANDSDITISFLSSPNI